MFLNVEKKENKLEKFINNNKLFAQTHSGVFHCDDVFACALLELYCDYFDVELVVERNEVINEKNTLFFDIGKKHCPEDGYFDHHQEEEPSIMHTVKLADGTIIEEKRSAFGLLWNYLGELFLEKRAFWVLDTQFVSKIDHFDNYGGYDSLSLAIKDMNHIDIYARNTVTEDDQFDNAVNIAKTILKAKINALRDSQLYMDELFKYANSDEVKESGIVIVDNYIAGMNSALSSKTPWADFFIAPSGRDDTYNLFPIYIDKVGTPKIPIMDKGESTVFNGKFVQFKTVQEAVDCAMYSKEVQKRR